MVIGKDFSTVSGDILDFLKSILGMLFYHVLQQTYRSMYSSDAIDLKSCVFSFACDSTTNQMYLEALEERCYLVLTVQEGSMISFMLMYIECMSHTAMYCSVKDITLPSCRFHYYDCLVIPVASITNTFPWEKLSLLVEYESLGSALFPDGQQPVNLRLRQWVVLKTVQDISATSLAKSG